MSIHGTYRGVFSKLVDDPDFQALTSEARHTLLTMRLMPEIGPGSIWRAYLEPISHRTGYPIKRIEILLKELVEAGWIQWDGSIIWIVNGLKYDPTIKLTDIKHKTAVQRSLAGLPKFEIVLSFCDYYQLPRAFDGPSQGPRETYHRPGSPNPNPNPNQNQNTTTAETGRPSEGPTQGPSLLEGQEGGTHNQDWPSPKMLVQLYNELAPKHLPRVTTLNPQREKRAKSLLKVYPEQSWWEDVFTVEYYQSRFLMGKVKGNGHGNFLPHFDWIIGKDEKGQDNCVKVHDGNYRDPVLEKAASKILPPAIPPDPPCSSEVAQENLKRMTALFERTAGGLESKYPKL
jgi:hypothetical protein